MLFLGLVLNVERQIAKEEPKLDDAEPKDALRRRQQRATAANIRRSGRNLQRVVLIICSIVCAVTILTRFLQEVDPNKSTSEVEHSNWRAYVKQKMLQDSLALLIMDARLQVLEKSVTGLSRSNVVVHQGGPIAVAWSERDSSLAWQHQQIPKMSAADTTDNQRLIKELSFWTRLVHLLSTERKDNDHALTELCRLANSQDANLIHRAGSRLRGVCSEFTERGLSDLVERDTILLRLAREADIQWP